jgi:hypothetical protein
MAHPGCAGKRMPICGSTTGFLDACVAATVAKSASANARALLAMGMPAAGARLTEPGSTPHAPRRTPAQHHHLTNNKLW